MEKTDTFKTPPYLIWQDDHPKHTLAQKITDAITAHTARFGQAPTVALINPADLPASVLDIPITVRVTQTVGRSTVWVGVE